MATHDLDRDPAALLSAALAHPFVEYERFHYSHWLQYLKERFPLWSFNPRAYGAQQETSFPSMYPLPVFIRSILADEGHDDEHQHELDPLEAALDRRRCALVRGATTPSGENYDEHGHIRLLPGFSSFERAPDLADYEMVDDDGGYGYVSAYEDFGRELAGHLYERDFGMTKPIRQDAAKELRRLLYASGLLRRPGRPRRTPHPALLKALLGEGAILFALLHRDVQPPVTAIATDALLEAGGDIAAIPEWAERLALPILSARELRAWHTFTSQDTGRNAAREFTARVLAHRLAVQPRTILAVALGPAQAERCLGRPDPFAEGACKRRR